MEDTGTNRWPMTGKEYDNMRQVIVAVDELAKAPTHLKKRLQAIPHGWRNYKLAMYWMEKLCDDLLDTVPEEKLVSFQTELKNSKICLITKWAPVATEGVCQIPEAGFLALMERLIYMECWSCERKGADVRKCPIRKICLDCLHYEPGPDQKPKDGSCFMAGWDHIVMEK